MDQGPEKSFKLRSCFNETAALIGAALFSTLHNASWPLFALAVFGQKAPGNEPVSSKANRVSNRSQGRIRTFEFGDLRLGADMGRPGPLIVLSGGLN